MKNVILKVGSNVELYDGTKGDIINIDKSTYRIEISSECIMWTNILDVKCIDGVLVDDCNLII